MSGTLDDAPCVPQGFHVSPPRKRFVTYAESMLRGLFRELMKLGGSQFVVVDSVTSNIGADE
jgi:hypothetical protein